MIDTTNIQPLMTLDYNIYSTFHIPGNSGPRRARTRRIQSRNLDHSLDIGIGQQDLSPLLHWPSFQEMVAHRHDMFWIHPECPRRLEPHHKVSQGTDDDNSVPDAGSSRSSTHRYRSPSARRTPCSGIADTESPDSSSPSDTRTGSAAKRRADGSGSPSS